jgi:hypothetical protein
VRPAGDNLRDTLANVLSGRLSAAAPKPDAGERVRALTLELLEARAELARRSAPQTQQPDSLQSELADTLERVQRENRELLGQVAELHAELAAAQSARPQPGRSRIAQDDIVKMITALRPDLEFLRDSTTVLWGEYADRAGFCRAMNELGTGGMTSSWRKIRGAPGWWERHISNGQDDAGRIYARSRLGRWELLVSHKGQQERDIVWLRKQAD